MIEWKQIEDFQYSVSLKKDQFLVVRNDETGKILKHTSGGKGYMRVNLYKNKLNYARSIHVLLLVYFGPKRPSKHHTPNHKNGIKIDNRLDNLEWATPSEQQLHAVRSGLRNNETRNHNYNKGSSNSATNLVEEQVRKIREIWNKRGKKFTAKDLTLLLSLEYGVSCSTIQHIVYRATWAHV